MLIRNDRTHCPVMAGLTQHCIASAPAVPLHWSRARARARHPMAHCLVLMVLRTKLRKCRLWMPSYLPAHQIAQLLARTQHMPR